MLSFQDSAANRACNLECCQKLAPVHEFVGPVKIVMMDVPRNVYITKAWVSALIALAQMLMAITVMIVLFYTLSFKTPVIMNLHIVLCTIGFQLFMPSAILMASSLHGPAVTLKQKDRKFQHLFLQFFGISSAAAGSVLIMLFSDGPFKSKLTVHAFAGLGACCLCAAAALTGPGAYFTRTTGTCGKVGRGTHAFFGVPAFVTSSVCFIMGISYSKTFENWAFHPDLIYILNLFCSLYTIFIIITPVMKIIGNAP